MLCRNVTNADADCLKLEDFQSQQWQFSGDDQARIQGNDETTGFWPKG
jgi:hypothetical protein